MFDARSSAFSRLRSPVTTSASPSAQRAFAGVDRRLHQARDVVAQATQLVGQPRRGCAANGCPAKCWLKKLVASVELRRRVAAIGVQDAVLHVAFRRDDDQQHAPVGQPQELEVAERGFAALGVTTTPAKCVSCDSS